MTRHRVRPSVGLRAERRLRIPNWRSRPARAIASMAPDTPGMSAPKRTIASRRFGLREALHTLPPRRVEPRVQHRCLTTFKRAPTATLRMVPTLRNAQRAIVPGRRRFHFVPIHSSPGQPTSRNDPERRLVEMARSENNGLGPTTSKNNVSNPKPLFNGENGPAT